MDAQFQFASDFKQWERSKPVLCGAGLKSTDISINQRKGVVEGYLTKYFIPGTSTPVVDPYLDIVEPGAFTATIKSLEQARKSKGYEYLIPHLWQHNPSEVIGGDRWLVEDDKGVIFETQLAKGVRRADEALELIAQKMLPGISYGYDALRAPTINNTRHLKEVRLHETSSVTFPANEWAGVTDLKGLFTYETKGYPLAAFMGEQKQDAMDLNMLIDQHASSDAIHDFFNLMDMFGMAVMSQMSAGNSGNMQMLIDQLNSQLQTWASSNAACMCDDSSTNDSVMPMDSMGYMGLRGLSDLATIGKLQGTLTPELKTYLDRQLTFLQSVVSQNTHGEVSYAPSDITRSFKGWDALTPRTSASHAPLEDTYSIADLINTVNQSLRT